MEQEKTIDELKEELNKIHQEKLEENNKKKLINKLQREKILKENPNYYSDKRKLFLEKNPDYYKKYQKTEIFINYKNKWVEENRDHINEYQRNRRLNNKNH